MLPLRFINPNVIRCILENRPQVYLQVDGVHRHPSERTRSVLLTFMLDQQQEDLTKDLKKKQVMVSLEGTSPDLQYVELV